MGSQLIPVCIQNAAEHFKRIQHRLHRPATTPVHHRPNRNRVNGALQPRMVKKLFSILLTWYVRLFKFISMGEEGEETHAHFDSIRTRIFSNPITAERIIWKFAMDTGTNRPFSEDIVALDALWNLSNLVPAECYSLWSQHIGKLAYVVLLPAMKVFILSFSMFCFRSFSHHSN